MEAVAQLEKDPKMSGRFILSFRHLERQNLWIISDSIDWPRWCKNSRGTGGAGGAEPAGGIQLSYMLLFEMYRMIQLRILSTIKERWCEADHQGCALTTVEVQKNPQRRTEK